MLIPTSKGNFPTPAAIPFLKDEFPAPAAYYSLPLRGRVRVGAYHRRTNKKTPANTGLFPPRLLFPPPPGEG